MRVRGARSTAKRIARAISSEERLKRGGSIKEIPQLVWTDTDVAFIANCRLSNVEHYVVEASFAVVVRQQFGNRAMYAAADAAGALGLLGQSVEFGDVDRIQEPR
jgi:uncharacterized protein YcsI (UPF0317 family)